MTTIRDVVKNTQEYLTKRGVPCPDSSAELLLMELLNISRSALYDEKPFPKTLRNQWKHWMYRRGNREPLEYITQKSTFHGLELKIGPDVLIPRQETEILVDKIITTLKQRARHHAVVWDVGTGSGCIALAIKQACPYLDVYASDSCPKALRIAQENGDRHHLEIHWLLGDFLDPFSGTCDFFVCNPPYVTEEEWITLEPEVRQEPFQALCGGITFYERTAKELPIRLAPEGLGWMEIGAGQKESIEDIFISSGFRCRIEEDWAGLPRFFLLERDSNHKISLDA